MRTRAKTISATIGLVLTIMLLGGCSTTGELKMQESVKDKAVRGEAVFLQVTAVNPGDNNTAIQLKGQLASYLLGAGFFNKIARAKDEHADYTITVNLTEIESVSGVARVMLGVFAGRNKVAGDVTVVDAQSQQTVRAFSFSGESAAHPFSGKSDLSDAINKAVEEIAKGLK